MGGWVVIDAATLLLPLSLRVVVFMCWYVWRGTLCMVDGEKQ